MRHRRAGRKLGRTPAHRRALFRNLVTALLEHEQIRTTEPKAKEIRRLADRMITLGKRGTLHARRRALAFVRKRSVVKKLFDEVAPRFASRAGGYTRVIGLGPRRGDAAPLSLVELVARAEDVPATASRKKAPQKDSHGHKRATAGTAPDRKARPARPSRAKAGT
jgi:large subunit ribosomal protein L17